MAESTAKNYTAYVTKAPTPLHEFYAGWIAEKTGFEPDLKAVQIAVNLYGDFQKSPEWIAERDRLRAEADAAKLAAKVGKKPGTTKAEREAKKIADALEALKAAGIDTSGLEGQNPALVALRKHVASAVELPGNPVVEAGAVVETPADPESFVNERALVELGDDPEPVIGTNDTVEDDEALVAELEANPAPNPKVQESSPELDAMNTDFASEKAAQSKPSRVPARRAPKTAKVPAKKVDA